MSLKCTQSLRICTRSIIKKQVGTSVFTCQRASLTVEAAVVIPLTAGFLACILFLFQVLTVQAKIEEALIYAGRQTAVEASVVEREEALFFSAELHLLQALEDVGVTSQNIKNGSYGVNLIGSRFIGESIVLYAEYEIVLPVKFFGLEKIRLFSTNQFRKWTGDYLDPSGIQWVYITPTGEVYHTSSGCRVLDLSVHAVSIYNIEEERGKNGQKYDLCSRCGNTMLQNEWVYCTDYGTVYHKDTSCSFLKRTIERVEKSSVENRRECSFCAT